MHKSWGNAIEFDEAAERMGVDVMRWMFANARPEDNILFGWHAADEARRRLLVLWNVYSFFVTYARLADWQPARAGSGRGRARARSIAGSCPGSRGWRARSRTDLRDYDALDAAREIDGFIEELSTWYLRRSRKRFSRRRPIDATAPRLRHLPRDPGRADPDHGADPAVPGRVDVPEPRRRRRPAGAPDSVHLTAGRRTNWPA